VQNHTCYNKKCRSFEPVLLTRKKVGLEVNTKETKYVFMSHEQSVGENHHRKIGDKSFKIVAEYKYLGSTQSKLAYMNKLRADKRIILKWIRMK
jgi:hypothetical protein